jgi:hypothetical protein
MKGYVAVLVAIAGLAGSRGAREWTKDEPMETISDEPYAPSPAMAPIITIGYREMAADMLFIRLAGYFGGDDSTSTGIAALVEAIVALDPRLQRIYEYGAEAIVLARNGVDQKAIFHALDIFERGAREFPDDPKIPMRAGEMYLHDLTTKDPKKRREWDEKATLLIESATRKPGADAGMASELVATLQTKYGHRERAIAGLQEMLLVTTDDHARQHLRDKLAELAGADGDEIASELLVARRQFDDAWKATRPAINPNMYILLGNPLGSSFDLVDLATGGHDLVGSKPIEHLEPLE